MEHCTLIFIDFTVNRGYNTVFKQQNGVKSQILLFIFKNITN